MKNPVTFFVWSDTHFGYNPREGPVDHRRSIIQQMKKLAGRFYPPRIGGQVDNPALIIHCGDFVTGGGNGEEALADYLGCIDQIKLPSFETLGNHEQAHRNVVEYFVRKHGNRYYSFGLKGIHFICLYQAFDEGEKVQALDTGQLQWLENDVSHAAEPIVVFAHDRLDHLPNAEDVDSALSGGNILLMLSGHSHLQISMPFSYYEWKGRTGAVAGHCRNYHDYRIDPPSGRVILVVRITAARATVVPWRWDMEEWTRLYPEVEGGVDRCSE